MQSERVWRQYLQLIRRMGVTHLPHVQIPAPSTTAARKPRSATSGRSAVPVVRSSGMALKSPNELLPHSVQVPEMQDATSAVLQGPLNTAAEKSDALCRLAEVVQGCRRCTELAETRTQTVFGVGNPDAKIMFIGEAPGADEDRQGEPFVGRAGQLLNKIIDACQLTREEIYICNILRCRPPGNRNPLPQEAANCREYLDAQISVVQPEYIVCWGTVAAQNLLGEKQTIGRLRKEFHQHGTARVLCTYHPSYLLRNPSAKKDVWDDMQILMKELGIQPK